MQQTSATWDCRRAMDYTTAASCSDYDSSSLYSDESGLDAPSANQRPASHLTGSPSSTISNHASAAVVQPSAAVVTLRRPQSLLPAGARSSASSASSTNATSSYRFSMANLEETHEAELDAILGELSMLEQQKTGVTAALHQGQHQQPAYAMAANSTHSTAIMMQQLQQQQQQQQQQQHHHHRGHSRTNSMLSHVTNSTISSVSTSSESGNGSGSESGGSSAGGGIGGSAALREPHRTESPDNDSAFSDTVSLLSSESSASSGVSHHHMHSQQQQQHQLPANLLPCDSAKAAKIHLALQKLEQASVRRLFVKAFTTDGASKSLLVDERMTCGHVTRLLADKNHVTMEPHWALVEQLPDLQMERLFEDHELLVDNLMNWRSDSKNRVLFVQRPDKVSLYNTPERYLPGTQMAPGSDHDDHTRTMLLDEFFASGLPIAMEGALFLKPDAKKAWKRHHFVLRASGLYYFLKEKTKSTKDMVCHALFEDHDVYRGIGWKKKHKAPTDHTFALRQPRDNVAGKDKDKDKSSQPKLLCAEDADTLDRWLTAIRVAKYGRRLLDNQRTLIDDLQREELERFSANRCGSIGSIISSVPSQCSSALSLASSQLNSSISGRLSRASSSSSSGCLSDEAGAGFDSEFPNTGTIKRKPSMKPNLPLTSMTRQLKEVGETMTGGLSSTLAGNTGGDDDDEDGGGGGNSMPTSPERGGTLTRRHSRRRSEEGSNSGTLKRRPTAASASSGSAVSAAGATGAAGSAASSSGLHMASIVSLHRGSVDSMSSSSTSTTTPTGSAPGTPLQSASVSANQLHNNNLINNNHQQQQQHHQQHHHLQPHHTISPLEIMPACMTDSTFSLPPPPPPPLAANGTDELDNISMTGSTLSLESLPPPPPPCDLQHMADEFSASQTSLVSLPPPPPEIRPMYHMPPVPAVSCMDTIHPVTHFIVPAAATSIADQSAQPIYAKSTKPSSIIKAPPYKAPPPYNNNSPAPASATSAGQSNTLPGASSATGKSVTFADSPVLLRRKQVCFEDQVYGSSPRRHPQQPPAPPSVTMAMAAAAAVAEPLYVSSAPPPPPRAEATRLSTTASTLSLSHTSPKRLSDSQANPPPHFLKDLQRVMRKKWQVAQKCKLEPATTPHEVLGFRDFNGELQLVTAAGAAVAGPTHFYRETSNVSNWVQEHYGAGEPPADDSLYENLGGEMGAEPMPMAMKLMNKRPPPPPPKRSLSTQLSTQQLRSS